MNLGLSSLSEEGCLHTQWHERFHLQGYMIARIKAHPND